jgi:hypothetical protein
MLLLDAEPSRKERGHRGVRPRHPRWKAFGLDRAGSSSGPEPRRFRSRSEAFWRAGALRQRGRRLIAVTMLGAALLAVSAYAQSPKSVTLTRCGYANATYGRSALYPWQMSCAAARKVVTASDSRHAQVIEFGPGWGGGAVRINGRYWVCTGQMGYYNCGYPYRPLKVDGEQGYKGPFTKDVEYQTCSVIHPAGSGCAKTVEFSQPRN